MVPVDSFEKVYFPDEVQTLLECIVLHAFSNDEHRLELVYDEQITRLHSCCSSPLLVQFVNLCLSKVLNHVFRDLNLLLEYTFFAVFKVELLFDV